jgi:ABC-2 type transport system permease protein
VIAMLPTVYLKSLRDQRRALIGWGIGLILLVLLEAALWPSIRDMPDLNSFLANYPESMREVFNLDDFATGRGFFNAELFSAMLPVLFIIFAVGRGARLVAGEEEAGTLDVLLVTPVSPARLVISQAAALGTSLAGLATVLWIAGMTCSAAFGLGLGAVDLAQACVSMMLLGLEFGWLALAVGAVTGRRSFALAVPAVAAVAAYVLYVAGELVDAVQPWQQLSPFDHALAAGPLGAGWRAEYLWMPAVAVLAVALAMPLFDRRDIAAAR